MPKPERKIEKLTEDEKERVKNKIPPTMREMKEENDLNSLAIRTWTAEKSREI